MKRLLRFDVVFLGQESNVEFENINGFGLSHQEYNETDTFLKSFFKKKFLLQQPQQGSALPSLETMQMSSYDVLAFLSCVLFEAVLNAKLGFLLRTI